MAVIPGSDAEAQHQHQVCSRFLSLFKMVFFCADNPGFIIHSHLKKKALLLNSLCFWNQSPICLVSVTTLLLKVKPSFWEFPPPKHFSTYKQPRFGLDGDVFEALSKMCDHIPGCGCNRGTIPKTSLNINHEILASWGLLALNGTRTRVKTHCDNQNKRAVLL